MKKLLVMLPLVAVLAGCSASMRSGASVYVVPEPSVSPAYSGPYAWYGCPLPPLHAWIGLGWMNPFRNYGFYMSCCRRYGIGAFAPEEPDYSFSEGPVPSDGPKKMKVTPKARVMKPGRKYEAKVSLDKPARMSPAPRSGGEMESRAPGLSESRGSSSRGSSGRMERESGTSLSRASAERSEKSSSSRKKK